MNATEPTVNLAGDPIYVRVRDQLRQEILAGVFANGTRLKIAELAKRYNVSQMPVREALQQLQGEGLVIIEPNKGARVRNVDLAFIGNMYDIFAALEDLLVERATPLLDAQELRAARLIERQYEAASRSGDLAEILRQNQRFHHFLYQRAGNPEAMEIVERHWGLIDCLRRTHGFGAERTGRVIAEHRELLRALEAGDAGAARRVVRQHSLNARDDLIQQIVAQKGKE